MLNDINWFYDKLSASQNPLDCREVTSVLRVTEIQGTGLGTIINQLVGLLLKAARQGAVLIINEKPTGMFRYGSLACSGEKSWECFFLAPSSCTMASISPHAQVTEVKTSFNDHQSEMKLFPWWAFAYLMRVNPETTRQLATAKEVCMCRGGGCLEQTN